MRKLKELLFGLVLLVFVVMLDRHIFKEEKVRRIKWWWVVLALTVGLVSCMANQPTPVVVVPMSFRGATTCDHAGKPIIFLNPQVAGSSEENAVLVHERTHVAQTRRLGCRATMQRAREDSVFRYEMERDAYCSDFVYRQQHMGSDPEYMLSILLPYLQKQYRPEWTLEQIRADLPCGR